MKHRKVRRAVILVLVLVLLISNTLGAQADTGTPTVIVDSYGALYTAIAEAKDGEIIGIKGTITIPATITLSANKRYIVIKRMEPEAKLIVDEDYGADNKATFDGLCFDGNATEIGGTEPFIEVNKNAYFKMCDFFDFFNQGKNGGVICINSGNVEINSCSFDDNSAYNGSHIYNAGVLKIYNSGFKNGWADEAGGAIYNVGTVFLDFVEIKDNNARIGGGIYNNAVLEITNSLIWSNEAIIHGADIANEGSLTNYTTDEEYNRWLDYYKLYYAGWSNDTNMQFGGAGEYLKFLTSTEAPKPPVEPEPTDPTPEDPETPPSGGEEETEPPSENEQEPSGGNEGGGNEDPSIPTPEDPIIPDEEEKDPTEPTQPDSSQEPDNTEPTDPVTPPEETEEPDKPEDPTAPSESGNDQETDKPQEPEDPEPTTPATPSDAESTGGGDTVDNSNHSTTDNSQTNIDNSQSTSSVDNSSHESNDNSSYREDNSYRDSSSSTVNNYYQQESPTQEPTAAQNGSQPINITVPVEVSASQGKEAPTGSTEAPEGQTVTSSPQQNIRIEAEGVDLVYEYTENGVSISIKAPESPTEAVEAMAVNSSSTLTETPQRANKSPNWVEYVSMIFLAVLVGLEIRDKIKPHKEG